MPDAQIAIRIRANFADYVLLVSKNAEERNVLVLIRDILESTMEQWYVSLPIELDLIVS